MKLFTESQVYHMLMRARFHNQDDSEMFTDEYLISQEKPIELPSDEDIEKIINPNKLDKIPESWKAEIEGAKWMREQILKQIKSC